MIRIMKRGETADSEIFARGGAPAAEVEAAVRAIIADVRENGDEALIRYGKRFDRAELTSLEVTAEEKNAAKEQVGPEFLGLLSRAADRIRDFHAQQKRTGFTVDRGDGIIVGQRIIPVDRAGMYVPGGTAAYPSTVLMDIIPARLAGVPEVVMTTPPRPDGSVNPVILAAAAVAGVDRIFKAGGAQAIAALAYGTETVPKVDKIVGPGNAYVAEAKKQVYGTVSIDMVAGPSEIMIIADGRTDPAFAAADLLSQAEHDRNACAVLVTDSYGLAVAVRDEIERRLPKLERCDIARASIEANGKIIVCGSLDEAVDTANRIAPEHLELCVERPFELMERVRHAGSVFLGRSCPEALGDYYAGPNHTLPTMGTAHFFSPLGVDDFVKRTQFTYYTPDALLRAADDVSAFARSEGLTGHAESVEIRAERYRREADKSL
jgi:histidinol dehydrogenase